ncbi:MAG: hypothetical protein HY763_02975, partial [Planctomycetes bacterium]|nr:hypothetical protein [Planctomycetota bacterium]
MIPVAGDGWLFGGYCVDPCAASIDQGHLVLHWAHAGALVGYARRFPDPPPPSLWVEWRFRSNRLKPLYFDSCDGDMSVHFLAVSEVVYMFADAAVSFSGNDVAFGLERTEFHSYRLESPDGQNYYVSVDGVVFIENTMLLCCDTTRFRFGGIGNCPPPSAVTINEWDFVRLGTLSGGEQIVATNPPAGVLDPLVYPNLDRFLVTYDSPNYAYIDDITVEVLFGSDEATRRGTDEDGFRHEGTRARRHEAGAGDAQAETRAQGTGSGEQRAPVSRGLAPAWPGAGGDEAPRRQVDPAAVPQVIATRRRDNGNPEDLEIVLDRPMPIGATTRFTFNDGVTQNVVEYTLGIPGLCCLIGGGCAAAFDPTCTNAGG